MSEGTRTAVVRLTPIKRSRRESSQENGHNKLEEPEKERNGDRGLDQQGPWTMYGRGSSQYFKVPSPGQAVSLSPIIL